MFTDEQNMIFSALQKNDNVKVYVCGGFVRDYALGVQSKDMDVEVFGCTIEQLENVLSRFGKISTVGKKFGIVKLTTETNEYDFSVPRRENKIGVGRSGFNIEFDPTITPNEASARRDFTFNSMFMDINGNIHDPHNGMGDLNLRRLRHTSRAFSEDPTRVLRGMRFCGQLNLRPYRRTVELCKLMFDRYNEIEADMIWAEWEKWALRSVKHSRGLEFLWSTGWIHHYPELYNMTRIPQEPEWHPEGSVWQHTKHVVNEMNVICNRDNIVGEQKIIAIFGALLHDVGKPLCTAVNEYGRIVSPGHDEAGVDLAYSFMESIHMPLRYRDAVADLVRYHMRHINNVTTRSARRFASKLTNINSNDWLRIVEADYSGRPPLPKGIPEVAQTMYNMMIQELNDNRVAPLVLGRHLVSRGYIPSKLFGIVLNEVYEVQLDEGLDFESLLFLAISKMDDYGAL